MYDDDKQRFEAAMKQLKEYEEERKQQERLLTAKEMEERKARQHPDYYGGADDPYEAIKVINAWKVGFALGSVLKYIRRHGQKCAGSGVQDLKKARHYIDLEIRRLEGEDGTLPLPKGSAMQAYQTSAQEPLPKRSATEEYQREVNRVAFESLRNVAGAWDPNK